MKYIKNFESLEDRYSKNQELKDFCEASLAWLLDDGFEFTVFKLSDDKEIIRLIKRKSDNSLPNYNHLENWKLSEISDHFIPFLQKLSSKYDLRCIVDTNDRNEHIGPEVSIEDFISDRLNDYVFKGISIVVSEK